MVFDMKKLGKYTVHIKVCFVFKRVIPNKILGKF
jgi:hypothetical protein